MRRALASIVLVAGTATAAASPPVAAPIELLHAVPAVVAVSSTVENFDIVPEHLVDGDLRTAWNSRTNELVGAWIAVRVPASSHVTSIKLTVGFTAVTSDGDLFTMNPRIDKVRVTRAGKLVVEQALDPASRALQDIPIDRDGGDFKIEVRSVVAGSKKTWREACVSELQVWGTPGVAPSATRRDPEVRVGALDPPPAPDTDACVKLMFPDSRDGRIGSSRGEDRITGSDAFGLGNDLAVCRVDHQPPRSADTVIEIAAVRHGKTWTELGRTSFKYTTQEGTDANMGAGQSGSVTIRPLPLTLGETALFVEASVSSFGPMFAGGSTTSTVFRVAPTGFVRVLEFSSSYSESESVDRDTCKLKPFFPHKAMPELALACTKAEGRYHHEDPRGDGEFQTDRVERYRWDGAAFVPK